MKQESSANRRDAADGVPLVAGTVRARPLTSSLASRLSAAATPDERIRAFIRELEARRAALGVSLSPTLMAGSVDLAQLERDDEAVAAAEGERRAGLAELETTKELLRRERETASELKAANNAKDSFLEIVSHDLRNPLSAVLGWTTVLRSEALDATARGRALDTIERNARIQEELIESLLDVARITSGKLRLRMADVGLGDVVRGAVEAMGPVARERGVDLIDAMGGEAVTVRGDLGRLRQVVANLLSNALKFTPAGGRIEVQLCTVGETVQVVVTDSGMGIDPAALPFVFDRYRQERRREEQRDGLGLGLFIVRHIVEEHGGSIGVESDGIGRGCRVVVTLPAGLRTMPGRREGR